MQFAPSAPQVEAPRVQRARHDRALALGELHRAAGVRAERIEGVQLAIEPADHHLAPVNLDEVQALRELPLVSPFLPVFAHGRTIAKARARANCSSRSVITDMRKSRRLASAPWLTSGIFRKAATATSRRCSSTRAVSSHCRDSRS